MSNYFFYKKLQAGLFIFMCENVSIQKCMFKYLKKENIAIKIFAKN